MKNRAIFYGSQKILKEDISEVTKSLTKKKITTGDYVIDFENKIKNFTKSKFILSCNSGTSALFLALKSINLKKNDIVIMPAINFVASANIAKILGAKIFFADIDECHGQMSPDHVKETIKKFKLKKVKAIISMYLGGYPKYIKDFYKLKKKLKCYLIEDACHALGASYIENKKKYKIGSCTHSDICTFSLHPLKTITSGEGGVMTTNNKILFEKAKIIRSHGIVKNSKHYWNYDVIEHGFNLRLSDINCALGLSQLKRINQIINYRKKLYLFYYENLKKYKEFIKISKLNKSIFPSFHLVLAKINFNKITINKNIFLEKLSLKKIFCQYHYIPIYKFTTFKNNRTKNLTNCEIFHKNNFSLPIHLGLGIRDINFICNEIIKLIIKYKKK